MIGELTRCLTLCAPSGMSSDERAVWLATAWAEVSHIPAGTFEGACAAARKIVDHPSKIVPAIIKESAFMTDLFIRRRNEEEAAWRNRNAPRLTVAEPDPDPFAADREEVSAMMADLVATLKGQAATPDSP